MRARRMPVNVHLLSGQAVRVRRVREAGSARERRGKGGGQGARKKAQTCMRAHLRASARICAHAHACTGPRLGGAALRRRRRNQSQKLACTTGEASASREAMRRR